MPVLYLFLVNNGCTHTFSLFVCVLFICYSSMSSVNPVIKSFERRSSAFFFKCSSNFFFSFGVSSSTNLPFVGKLRASSAFRRMVVSKRRNLSALRNDKSVFASAASSAVVSGYSLSILRTMNAMRQFALSCCAFVACSRILNHNKH